MIVLHVGGAAGGVEAGTERFEAGFARLSEAARRRLVIENDDRTYALADVLPLARRLGVPVVWDILHHHCHDPEGIPDREALELALATWPDGVRPKIHFSSPRLDVTERKKKVGRRVERKLVLPDLRHHADLVDPLAFEEFLRNTAAGLEFDTMLEAKAKDLAVLRLRDQLAARRRSCLTPPPGSTSAWPRRGCGAPARSRSTASGRGRAVLRAPTDGGDVWLKAPGAGTAFEVPLYELLGGGRARADPCRRSASTVERGWVLLPDGGEPLGEHLKVDDLAEALAAYAQLQRDLAPHAGRMLGARPGRHAAAGDAAAVRRGRWTRSAATPEVEAMRETYREWCERLAASPVPASIDHNDLHPWNILDGARFYDWGDAVVAHPFASMLGGLGFSPIPADAVPGVRDAYLAGLRRVRLPRGPGRRAGAGLPGGQGGAGADLAPGGRGDGRRARRRPSRGAGLPAGRVLPRTGLSRTLRRLMAEKKPTGLQRGRGLPGRGRRRPAARPTAASAACGRAFATCWCPAASARRSTSTSG